MEKPSLGLDLFTYRDEDAMVSAIIAPSGRAFIISCDFEELLPESGGYKSKDIPWINE